jgi:hypothetical protein
MIRSIVCILLLGACPAFAGNAGSAIAALQAVASNPAVQNSALIELSGRRGDPVPPEWTILLADPSARGGVREMTVAAGQITSERTPLVGYSGVASRPALDRTKVSVDANSVFDIAQREAVAARIGFHWIDYSLATNPATFQPEWTVHLYDSSGSTAGTLRIAALGGSVIEPILPREVSGGETSSRKKVGGLVGKIVDFAETAGTGIRDTTLRTIGNVQEFLVGERTIGPPEK